MKKIISCFVCFTIILSAFSIAFAATPDSFKMGDNITATYSADQSVLTVEGSGKMWDYTDETCIDNQLTKKIIIKADIENISEYAFSSFTFVKEISLPEGLESIGEAAFQYTKISELTLPDSVSHIGDYAFSGNINLTEITLPKNLTFIGEGAFAFCENLYTVTLYGKNEIKGIASAFDLCENLKSFNVAPDNQNYVCVDGVLYTKGRTTLVKYPNGKSQNKFIIPSGVKVIGEHAFAETKLEQITFNEGLTKINSYAFFASSIESIALPDSVKNIGAYAFSECFNAKKLVLPKRLKAIKESAFMGVNAKKISIPNSVTYIGKYAFANCSKLESVTLPKNLKTIKPYAFNNCEKLSLVNLSSSLAQGIGEAFRECNSIEKFKVSKTNKKYSVKKDVLFNKNISRLVKYPAKKSGKSYTVPSSVKVIDKYAFSSCLKLKNISLPKNLKKIYNNAFETTAISKVDLPKKLTYIGANAFSGSRLKSITFNNKLKTIGKDAFFACDSLKTVNLNRCETKSNLGLALNSADELRQFKVSKKNRKFSVKDGVLFNKSGTKLIMYPVGKSNKRYTVPSKVSSIGDYAFYCAYKLNKITLPKKLKTIGNSSFFATGATKITLPASVTKIGRRAFCAGDVGDLKITMLCKKAPKISKQSFINVSDGSDCIIYVKSKSLKSDLQKQFKSKNIESKIIVK